MKFRLLLVTVLTLSGIGYGSGPQANGKPKIQLEHPVNPHLDVPKNCQSKIQADDSVLLTCECEGCGTVEAQDEREPDPWVCKAKDGGLYCSYDLDTETSAERRHSRI